MARRSELGGKNRPPARKLISQKRITNRLKADSLPATRRGLNPQLSNIGDWLVNPGQLSYCRSRQHRILSSRDINFKSFTKSMTTSPCQWHASAVHYTTPPPPPPTPRSLFLHQPSTPILPFLSLSPSNLQHFHQVPPILMCRLTCGRADQTAAICHRVVT